MGLRHVLADIEQRALEEFDELVVKDARDGSADDQIRDGVDQALSELFEMLHKAHPREFNAFRYGLAGFFEGFELRHVFLNHGASRSPFRFRRRCWRCVRMRSWAWAVRSRAASWRCRRRWRWAAEPA